ncbi:stage II sporulation protein E [Clostridium thermarum]|uniref:stage II sporulation protein E n=1 Tax=Clostridium thermarum TaxID=1716543 RepID=UPI0013D69D7B|nr:stage II sporulation protein E [Clostridium thermarum]
MQYGVELKSYKREKKLHKKEKTINYSWYAIATIYFVAAFLISRVILINNSAPFGIAFIISVVINKEDDIPIVAGCGALLGYISIFNNLENLPVYILAVGAVVSGGYFARHVTKNIKLLVFILFLFFENLVYMTILGNDSTSSNALTAFFEVGCTLPIYYMISYAISCLKDIKSKHIFKNEEIISVTMIIALTISGTWGANLWGISVRNIIAFIFIIICAYINGASVGAASGVAIGLIVGVTTDNLSLHISYFGLCGLTVGLFKEGGKWFSGMAFVVSFFIIKLYSDIAADFKLLEVLIAMITMLSIPDKFYNILMLEFNMEKKVAEINSKYVDAIRDMFLDKLSNFSDILYNMSHTVKDLVNNDKLLLKNKSSALVENLADRVCANCSMNSVCWKREIYYTFAAFSELIQNYHENNYTLPEELEKKCIKKDELAANTQDLINIFITNEMWRSRLVEGRQLIAGHLSSMGDTVKEIVGDFNTNIVFNGDKERYIKRMMNKKGIGYSHVLCFEDSKGRNNVKIAVTNCKGSEFCVKEILPVVNQATGVSMCVCEEECCGNSNGRGCSISFEETPKYHIVSHVIRECKSGEKYNGDSYSFGKLQDGTYMIIISDGMGSGPEAGQESRAAVEMIERFSKAGFSMYTAVNTVNSIMTMKFSEEEKFSTLDIANIDLYTGDLRVMKIGAVATYIKSKEKVEIINSKTLPIGVLDKVDVDVTDKKVKNGDIIVMLSDGVLECEGNSDSMQNWITNYLEKCIHTNPKDIAEEIAARVKEVNNGKANDDMTVIASRVYSLY